MRPVRWMFSLLFALLVVGSSFADVEISVNFAPPALPVYQQPACPDAGYIWVPGYWAYADAYGYYWVPGTWVQAPQTGYLWTPGYWGWQESAYYWHPGYWGPVVGFYGGIDYGYGYYGNGYQGGYWRSNQFYYNRSVNNVNVTNIRNVYNNTTVVQNTNVTRVSYNGGQGGIAARPTARQEAAIRENHVGPTSTQLEHERTASSNRELAASVNHGKPPIAATQRAGNFHAAVVPATRGANYTPPANAKQPEANKTTARNVSPANPRANNSARPEAARPEPKAAEPKAEPKAAEPKPAEPKAAEPKRAEPRAPAPKAAEPKVEPKPAPEPKATAPKPEPKTRAA